MKLLAERDKDRVTLNNVFELAENQEKKQKEEVSEKYVEE